jgi:hypothetical protein
MVGVWIVSEARDRYKDGLEFDLAVVWSCLEHTRGVNEVC